MKVKLQDMTADARKEGSRWEEDSEQSDKVLNKRGRKGRVKEGGERKGRHGERLDCRH